MERLVRTVQVDGHAVAVVERVDDASTSYVLLVDDVVVDDDLPLPGVPDDRVLERLARASWGDS